MLAPDAACPVCGSTDHPHLAHPSALNDMVATVRRRRQELDAALDGISLRLGAATRALAAAEVRQSEATRGIDSARSQALAAEGDYNEQSPLLSDLCGRAGLVASVPLCAERARRVRIGGTYRRGEGGAGRCRRPACRCQTSSDGDRRFAAGVRRAWCDDRGGDPKHRGKAHRAARRAIEGQGTHGSGNGYR